MEGDGVGAEAGARQGMNDARMAATTAAVPRKATPTTKRNATYLPTPLERLALGVFPLILVFGTVFSRLSPETRAAPYYAATQSHAQSADAAPSYFARKSNLFNVFFVKRGWAWTWIAFGAFALNHASFTRRRSGARLAGAGFVRLVAVTGWWFVVTQWCFGPPLIDRGFRWTGGQCELVRRELETGGGGGGGSSGVGEKLTAVACRAAGGRWEGGHEISGHVFLLVFGTLFLMEEVAWPLMRWSGRWRDDRCVVMRDGAVKGAGVEADETTTRQPSEGYALGKAGKAALVTMALNLWMLLMTAIYFHTWFEKLTGLVTALVGWYAVYIVPRCVPALRAVVGLPAI